MLTEFLHLLSWILEQLLALLLGVGFAKLQPILEQKRRKNNLDYVLKLNNNDIKVIIPVREGELDDDYATKLTWNKYVTFEESLVFVELQKVLEETRGTDFKLTTSMINPDVIGTADNVICIGGPMASRIVARFFRKGELLDKIKFRWTNRGDKDRLNKYSDFIYLADEEIIDGVTIKDNEIKVNNKAFRYDLHNQNIESREGYIFLARLIGENDFGDREHGTVHIIFGNNAACTLAAFKIFITQQRALIKKIKEKRRFGHYVFLIKCKMTITGAEPNFKEFYDYTEECFGEEV